MRAFYLVLIGTVLAWGNTSLETRLLAQEAASNQEAKPREQIGEVLGKPVYRDEIKTEGNVGIRSELARLFLIPVRDKYHQKYGKEYEATEEELQAYAKYIMTESQKKRDDEIELDLDLVTDDEILEQKAEIRRLEKMGPAARKKEGIGVGEIEKAKKHLQWMIRERETPGYWMAVVMVKPWKFNVHLYHKYGEGRVMWQQFGLEAFDAMHAWLKEHEKKGDFKITDHELRKTFFAYWNRDHSAFMLRDQERIQTEFLEPVWLPKGEAIKQIEKVED